MPMTDVNPAEGGFPSQTRLSFQPTDRVALLGRFIWRFRSLRVAFFGWLKTALPSPVLRVVGDDSVYRLDATRQCSYRTGGSLPSAQPAPRLSGVRGTKVMAYEGVKGAENIGNRRCHCVRLPPICCNLFPVSEFRIQCIRSRFLIS